MGFVLQIVLRGVTIIFIYIKEGRTEAKKT